MRVMHVALGGCLTAPPIRYGITEDTGGHIAYVLAAAEAQARSPDIARVEIVTRAFEAPELGIDCTAPEEWLDGKRLITRLATDERSYLSKEALEAELPALEAAFIEMLRARTHRPDVIHAHFSDAARLAMAAERRFGCATVYTPHSLAIDKVARLGGTAGAMGRRIAAEKAALTGAGAVIVSSRDEAERQVAGYGEEVSGQIHRIRPGSTLTPEGGADGCAGALRVLSDPARPMILAVARPVRRKNLTALARAFAERPALHMTANLVILAGQRGERCDPGEEGREVAAELEAIAALPHLAGRVALPERHAAGDVTALYRHAARSGGVFVNVALHEPFGLTLLEAAECGLPVVATREGGAADIVRAIGHGALVDPSDTRAIGAAIAGLLEDRGAWERAARAAAERRGAFDWDAWASGAMRVYRGLHARPRAHAGRHLLACDIDGTLTGSRAGARRFADWAARRDIPFAVATGRSLSEARAVLAEWDLPGPDVFVTAVGTEVHLMDETGRWRLCESYAEGLDRGWDRTRVLSVLKGAGLRLQPEIEQRRWKLGAIGTPEEAARLEARLAEAGLAARVIHSHERLIDVLAPRGGKAAAIAHLARRMGLSLGECIAAGDSGNDADMLAACGTGIVVANALPELEGRLPRHPGLYRAAAPHADGVLEGLERVLAGRVAA